MSTEREMLDLIHRRYGHMFNGASPRYVVAEHVRLHPAWGGRILDAVVADVWESDGYAMHGLEVKCSRSDLKRELDDPTKAAAFAEHLDYFWIVASSDKVLSGLMDAMPGNWGILIPDRTGLRAKRSAKRLRERPIGYTPKEPMPRSVQVAMLRSVRKTYEARGYAAATEVTA